MTCFYRFSNTDGRGWETPQSIRSRRSPHRVQKQVSKAGRKSLWFEVEQRCCRGLAAFAHRGKFARFTPGSCSRQRTADPALLRPSQCRRHLSCEAWDTTAPYPEDPVGTLAGPTGSFFCWWTKHATVGIFGGTADECGWMPIGNGEQQTMRKEDGELPG